MRRVDDGLDEFGDERMHGTLSIASSGAMLDANLKSWSLPFYGRTDAVVLAQLSNTPLLTVDDTVRASEGIVAACSLTGSIQVAYNRFGVALGVAAYEEVANSITNWFGSTAEELLQAAHDSGGTPPRQFRCAAYGRR